jgi:hypothetical protein
VNLVNENIMSLPVTTKVAQIDNYHYCNVIHMAYDGVSVRVILLLLTVFKHIVSHLHS